MLNRTLGLEVVAPRKKQGPFESVVVFRPATIRLPKSRDACPHTGYTRSFLWNLVQRGDVIAYKDSTLEGGRGIILIDFESLMEHIASLPRVAVGEAGVEAC